MPIGFQLQPIKMSLVEAQFSELRKYTALQIAAAFGIKPNQLNDYDKSSYSNSETQQLSFLIDTMLYRLTQYEQELNYKCLSKKEIEENYFFKFNEKVLLRTDFKTQMDSLRVGVNNGIYTPNEARELLDRPSMEGGDILMCNGNYIPVTSVQNKEGGDNGGGN
jgi:HK97 family phage portal protein